MKPEFYEKVIRICDHLRYRVYIQEDEAYRVLSLNLIVRSSNCETSYTILRFARLPGLRHVSGVDQEVLRQRRCSGGILAYLG